MLEGARASGRVLDELLQALPRETDELNAAVAARSGAHARSGGSRRPTSARRSPASRTDPAGGAGAAPDGERQGGVVRDAAQRRADARGRERGWNASGGEDAGRRAAARRRRTKPTWRSTWPSATSRTRRRFSATQLARFGIPTGKARFAFIMPAVSSDADVRERFFASLRDSEEPARTKRGSSMPRAISTIRCVRRPSRSLVRAGARPPARDPADGRHLLSQAMGRRHARRLQSIGRRPRRSEPSSPACRRTIPPRLRWVAALGGRSAVRAAALSASHCQP